MPRCSVDGIIYYRVMEPEMAAYQVTNLTLALTTLAMTNIRAVIGEMELDATLSSRERINTALLIILDGATMPWGVKVSRVEIRKIEPPENLIRAMNLQMTAERERRAAVARAEGERQAAILRAEGEKQALILAAEGRQQAALRDAEARVALARAEAEATQMVSEAATQHGQAGLRYFIATAMCGRSRRWHRRRTRAWSWCRWNPRRSPAASCRRWSCSAAMTARPAAVRRIRRRRHRRRRRRRRSCRRRCRRSPPMPAACPVGSRHAGMSDWIIWLVAGLVLLMLEILAPGAFMMWLGLAACGTGLIVLATGIGFELQVVTFAVLAAISLAIGLRFRYRRPPG